MHKLHYVRLSRSSLVSPAESLAGSNLVATGHALVRKEREEGGNLKISDEDDKNHLTVIRAYELQHHALTLDAADYVL